MAGRGVRIEYSTFGVGRDGKCVGWNRQSARQTLVSVFGE